MYDDYSGTTTFFKFNQKRKMDRSIAYAIPVFILLSCLICCDFLPERKPLPQALQSRYLEQGQSIVNQSLQSFSSELKFALLNGGAQNAINYCHLYADVITDSLSTLYDVKVSRVTDRNRNPDNAVTDLDLLILTGYLNQLAEGRDVQPHLEVNREDTIYYSPIMIQNPMCLICHGEPGINIQNPDYDIIRSIYPDDRATGYKLNDLRGLWKVEF